TSLFTAEDGIRDDLVTGVQTCALPIYAFLFVANLVATFVASVMDGATFVLLIPFLRTLFGHDPLPVAGGSAVERLLAVVVGPLLAAGAPGAARRNIVLGLVGAQGVMDVRAYVRGGPCGGLRER